MKERREEEGDQEGGDMINWNGDGAAGQATSSCVGQVRLGQARYDPQQR